MNPELIAWQEKVMPQERLENSLVGRIVEIAWPGSSSLPPRQLARLFGDVRDIIDGHPTPTRSRAERELVKKTYDEIVRLGS